MELSKNPVEPYKNGKTYDVKQKNVYGKLRKRKKTIQNQNKNQK